MSVKPDGNTEPEWCEHWEWIKDYYGDYGWAARSLHYKDSPAFCPCCGKPNPKLGHELVYSYKAYGNEHKAAKMVKKADGNTEAESVSPDLTVYNMLADLFNMADPRTKTLYLRIEEALEKERLNSAKWKIKAKDFIKRKYELLDEVEELKKRIEQLEKTEKELKKFAEHFWNCPKHFDKQNYDIAICSCGLSKLLGE